MSENIRKSNLFKDFSHVTAEDWKKQILKDLKAVTDADKNELYQTQLRKSTFEGITLEPFYGTHDLPGAQTGPLRTKPGWFYREEIAVTQPNSFSQRVTEAVTGGAQSILFDIFPQTPVDFNSLLQTVDPARMPVSFRIKALNQLAELLPLLGTEAKGSLDYALPVPEWQPDAYQVVSQAIRHFSGNKYFKALTVSGHYFHEAGASAVQELACVLASVVELLDKFTGQNVPATDILGAMEVSLSVDTNYFLQIAKVRALRPLVSQIGAAYGVADPVVSLHVRTARWNKFGQDAYNNMLRATLEGMAGVLGGCDSLTIEGYNARFAENDAFARRIARNVSAILREESFLGKVADPAAGAYFIENLTHSLASQAWQLFQTIEAKGGFSAAWDGQFIGREISAVRQQKEEAFRSGQQTLVGINKYLPQGGTPLREEIFERLPT